MILLLDQGLPRTAASRLKNPTTDVLHTGDIGLAAASDEVILERAREEGWTVVTLDADFHAILALSGAARPSVIRVRIEGLDAGELATLLQRVVGYCGSDLEAGAMATVTESGVRIRRLPLLR